MTRSAACSILQISDHVPSLDEDSHNVTLVALKIVWIYPVRSYIPVKCQVIPDWALENSGKRVPFPINIVCKGLNKEALPPPENTNDLFQLGKPFPSLNRNLYSTENPEQPFLRSKM